MTSTEKITVAALLLGYALAVVGIAVALNTGWACLFAGLLLIVAAVALDAR